MTAEKKKPFEVRPCQTAACIMLAGDIRAGNILSRMVTRQRNGWTVKSDGKPDEIRMTKNHWMIETGLSRHQYDAGRKIIERKNLAKFSYKKRSKGSKYLSTCVVVPDETISAVADLMKLKDQTSNADINSKKPPQKRITKTKGKSEYADNDDTKVSANTDDMNDTYNKKNDKKEINDQTDNDFSQKTKQPVEIVFNFLKENKKVEELENKDIEQILDFVFNKSTYTPDHYTKNNLQNMKKCLCYLQAQDFPLNIMGQACSQTGVKAIDALYATIIQWPLFTSYIEYAAGAFKIPARPTFTRLNLNQTDIPDFFRFQHWITNEVDWPDDLIWGAGVMDHYSEREIVHIFYHPYVDKQQRLNALLEKITDDKFDFL